MSSTLLAILLGAAALVLFIGWELIDHRRHRRARAVAADVAELGDDLLPTSIHPLIDAHACIGSGACVRACPEDDVIAIVHGRAELINPLACIGHGRCMTACPVQAITLVFGTAARGLELPAVSTDFETTRAGVYVVGELGGMGLIRNATEQGRQAAAAIARSSRRGAGDTLDAVVVGGGPAGIATTLGLMAAGKRALLVEQGELGGAIRHYPRAKVVMTGNLELPGYGTVRKKTLAKEELEALFRDIQHRTQLPLETGLRVDSVVADGDGWIVRAGSWECRAANVVLALGRRGAPRTLGVPGEDLAKVSYRVLEPEPFAGKHVLVVGGGNAAADCVIALAAAGCKSLGLSYRRGELARLRGSVRAAVDREVADGRITLHLRSEVEAIDEDVVVLRTPEGRIELPNDQVVIQVGGTAPDELLRGIGIELIEKRGEA
ncbi:MAG: NAD(P)-binding domain-containing protein [Deltaproteobacteria bacterium]|nr:NAD(P)-binding domain-containing protein [Deltaproteobacteria bacterium]